MKDIFERDMAGEPVSIDEPEYYKINEQIIKAQKISAELNCGYKTPEEVRALIAELTGTEPNETLRLIPPFQSGLDGICALGIRYLSIPAAFLWIGAGSPSVMTCSSVPGYS